jgi:glyoxylase-like metal-dependent hydrolase (beta-lactamase superfamily II)
LIASQDEIRQAYLDLVRVWHPDRFASDARLREIAEEKLENVRKYAPRLAREIQLYKGQAQRLGTFVASDIPTGAAKLDKIVQTLESYLALAAADDAGELPVPATSLVRGGDRVVVGATSMSVIHLRGHTPGSIALCYDADGALAGSPHLFTGDSLFPGGPGNTEGDPKRFGQLMDDLEERVFGTLPDGTWVYPGHGKDTTLGAERPHVVEWRERGW